MSILAILEVAIGLIFAWLVLSMAGMYIQELIVSKFNWRSNMLENHISNLLTEPTISRQLYDHPLIKGLHSGSDGTKKPSYIPSAQFSMALMDMVRNSSKDAALIQNTLYDLIPDVNLLPANQRTAARKQLDYAINITRKAVSSDGGEDIINGMLDEVKKLLRKLSSDYPKLQPMIEAKFTEFGLEKKQVETMLAFLQENGNYSSNLSAQEQFKTGLAVLSITHPDLKQAIEALTNDISNINNNGDNIYQVIQKRLEDWFNNSMDRLSGWYKRRAQTMAFFIGILLALFLNVDSLQLATQLWRDPSVRAEIAAQAEALVNKNPNGVPAADAGQLLALNIQISQLNIPVGWIGTGLPADASGAVFNGDGTQILCTLSPKSSVNIFGFHLGDQCYPVINTPKFNDVTGWILKLLGLLLTGAAVAQGAPFWFDILKNVVNVRMTGLNSDSAAPKGVR